MSKKAGLLQKLKRWINKQSKQTTSQRRDVFYLNNKEKELFKIFANADRWVTARR